MPTPTFAYFDGFEHGLAGTGNNGPYNALGFTQSIVTSPVRTGTRAGRCNPAATTGYFRRDVTASTVVCDAFYLITPASLPAADSLIAKFGNVNGHGQLWFNQATQKFALRISSSSNVDGPTLAADTTYRVVWEYDTSTGTATLRAIIDNGNEFTTGRTQTSLECSQIFVGTDASATVDWVYDDWQISVTDGDYEELKSWTAHSVEGLHPNADGTHNVTTSGDFDGTTTQFSNATTDSYLNIDDQPLNTSNTDGEVVRQDLGTTSEYMEHLYSDLAAGTDVPLDVKVYDYDVDGASTGTNLAVLKFLLEDDTPVTDVRLSSDDPGTVIALRQKILDRPAGGWTRANVNSLKSRWGFADGDPDAILLGVAVEVAMSSTPPSPGASFPARRSIVG